MTTATTCFAITTAEKYNSEKLQYFFPKAKKFEHEKDALFLESKEGQVLIFGFGCVVFWAYSKNAQEKILQKLDQCASKSYKPEEESYPYSYGNESKIFNDAITLVKNESLDLQLLTISYGIAQSLKLSVFEKGLMGMIKKTNHIPKDLQEKGKISMSSKEINQNIGSLIMAKHTINLHSDMLDSPDFLWENGDLEPLYHQTINNQDLPTRVQVLNKRLDIVQDLFQILGDELKNRHSFIIENIIVLLIALEVIISVFSHFF